MDPETARDALRERYWGLSSRGFHRLGKEVITKAIEPTEPHLTDSAFEPTIVGRFGNDPLAIPFGARIRQFENKIRETSIRQFIYHLKKNNCDIGCFITSSHFTEDAREAASNANMPLRLVNGDELTKLLIMYDIGIIEKEDNYEINEEWWKTLETPKDLRPVPGPQIPQANDLAKLNLVIKAVYEGNHFKPEISYFVERNSGKEWEPRQASYYATAGWLLDFLTRSWENYNGRRMRRYELTVEGKKYAEQIESREVGAEELLRARIRSVEIINRLVNKLEHEESVPENELKEFYRKQIELGDDSKTTSRRFGTIKRWLEELPEIHVPEDGGETPFRYLGTGEKLTHYLD